MAQISWADVQAFLAPAGRPAVPRKVANRALIVRLLAGALVCLAAAPLLPWPIVAAWLCVVVASGSLEERAYRSARSPAAATSPKEQALPALLRGISSTLFAAMAAALIIRGGEAAREFAVVMLAASILHVLMRYYRSQAVFVLCIAPHIAVLTWVGMDLTRAALAQGELLAACTPTATAALFAVLLWASRTQLAEGWADFTEAANAAAEGAEAREGERVAEAANAAKSSFLACMNHELRSPLTGMLEVAQMMAADELSKDQRKRLNIVRRSGLGLLSVLDDLLELAAIDAVGLEPVREEFHLAHLVRGIGMTFEHFAEKKGLSFDLAISATAQGVCLGDDGRLRRVLSAIISNAVKFTDAGAVRVHVERSGDEVQFRVTDTGVGIPHDRLPHIFDMTFGAERTGSQRGPGLGLAICEQLAGLMNGSIEVSSELGVGSTFTLRLPLPLADRTVSTAHARHSARHPVLGLTSTPQEIMATPRSATLAEGLPR